MVQGAYTLQPRLFSCVFFIVAEGVENGLVCMLTPVVCAFAGSLWIWSSRANTLNEILLVDQCSPKQAHDGLRLTMPDIYLCSKSRRSNNG
jgi:hypothetical protein